MLKPHLVFKRGQWWVWNGKAESKYALPTVIRKTVCEALRAHRNYVGEWGYT